MNTPGASSSELPHSSPRSGEKAARSPIERIRAAAVQSQLPALTDEDGEEAALSPIERIRAAAALAEKSQGRSKTKQIHSSIRPPLAWIATYHTLAKVREALVDGAHPDERDYDGRTALMIAAKNELPMMVATLAPISDWHARDKEGMTALGHAATASTAFFKKLVAMLRDMPSSPGSPISRWESDGALGGAAMASALHSGTREGQDIADWLATQGVDPNFRENPEDMPLLSIAVDTRRLDLAKSLLAMGADPVAICAMRHNRTALMDAANNANVELCALLTPLGGARMVDSRGDTALMLAASRGNAAIVANLLPHSDPDARNHDGKAAIHFAFEARNPAAFVALASDQEAWLTDAAGITRLDRMARDGMDEPELATQLALKMTRSAPASKSLLTLAKAWGVFECRPCPATAQALETLCDALAARLEIGAAASEPAAPSKPRHSL